MNKIALVRVDGYPGIGTLIQENTHFAVVEFRMYKHRWEIIADTDDYEIIGYINIPHQKLEEM